MRAPRGLLINQRCADTEHAPADPVGRREFIQASGYARLHGPAVVVYQLEADQHRQTGVVVEVSVDDYRNGRIRRHEATQPERERQLDEFTEAAKIEQMPVMLTHATHLGLSSLFGEIESDEPTARQTSSDDTIHTVWVRHDADLVAAVQDEIGHVETLYIADGHHRMVVAERYAKRRGHLGTDHAGAFTLAALFPSDELRIFGYHRCLPLPAETSAHDVLQRLAALPVTARFEKCAPGHAPSPERGVIVVRAEGQCYQLWLHTPAHHVRSSLDVVVLDEAILPPILGFTGQTGLATVPSGGNGGNACWCAQRNSLSFFPHPPSIEQVMAVSDAGLVMPPKATWFAPKASSGLFVRELA